MAGPYPLMTQILDVSPVKVLHKNRFLCSAFLLICTLLISLYAHAAQSNRIELNTTKSRIFLTKSIYVLPENNGLIPVEDAKNIAAEAQNANTNAKKILRFGTAPQPQWLAVHLTNRTANEKWLLSLGSFLEGRIGAIKAIKVINTATDETALNWTAPEAQPSGALIPVTLPTDKTSLLLIGLSYEGFLPAQIVPSLVAADNAKLLKKSDYIQTIISVCLLLAAGFFLSLGLVKRHYSYLSYTGYFLGNLALLSYLDALTWQFTTLSENIAMLFASISAISYVLIVTFAQRKNIAYSLVSISLIIISSAFIFLPIPFVETTKSGLYILTIFAALLIIHLDITPKKDARIIKESLPYYFTAYATTLISLLLSLAAYSLGDFNAAWASDLYIYSLIPQIILFSMAARVHFLKTETQEQAEIARKSRSTRALARLQQSKDAADQARLLRVIERERELMGDLREQESERAEEMRRAKEEADAANDAKSAFLAVVSHEIRTPMNGIMGILKLLQDTNLSKEQKDFLLTMQKTGDTMVALLNDILDFEKIENGSMELEHINIDLHSLGKGIVTLMTGYIKGKNVQLACNISPDMPRFVMGDPTRLQQVLFNLTSNALKFTDEGSVTITLEKAALSSHAPHKHAIKFSVTDTGIGISDEAQKNLFQPFKQAEKSTARKYGGTGLGLAICMRLVQNMGSKINVTSTMGQGTSFFFTLEMDEGYEEKNSEDAQAPDTQNSPRPKLEINPLDVMVIEDNEINRKVMQSLLEKDSHKVTVFASAEEALEQLEALRPDIIFTDINLLGMSGLEFTRRVRAMDHAPSLKDLPIVGLTGNVRPQDLEDMRAAGLDDSLAKPIDYSKVQEILANLSPVSKKETQSDSDSQNPIETEVAALTPPPQPQTPQIMQTALAADLLPPTKKPLIFQQTQSPLQELALSTPADNHKNEPLITPEETPAAPEPYQPEPYQPEPTPTPIEEPAPMPPPATTEPPSPAQSNALPADHYDMTMLQSLLDSLGKDTLNELIDGCLEQADTIIAAMQGSDQKDDPQFLNARMHELKGMAYNFGLKHIGDLAKEGEHAAKDGDLQTALSMVEALTQARAQTRADMENWMKS